ncbi:MAG TPA: hypothetical protein VE109_10340 [Acidobacteriaceae bacterium]|nr:hypothetical protein [Acidobacteriaceae bacterium]
MESLLKVVAQREPAGDDDRHGPDGDGIVLGGADKYALAAIGRDRQGAGRDDVGRCAQRACMARVRRLSPIHGVPRIVSAQFGTEIFFPGELIHPYGRLPPS